MTTFRGRMLRGRAVVAGAVFAVVAAVLSGDIAPPPDAGPISTGKQGASFYAVDQSAVAGPPGTLLRAQRLASQPIQDATTWRVLYVSRDGAGQPIAVSGTVSIPQDRAPEAGWPVLSYGHGTTGVADQCAPSRATLSQQSMGSTPASSRILREFTTEGFVVAQSDYEGLGTPGAHPYLDGRVEARGVIDIVRAAASLDERVSTRWVAVGYSQGAKAVVWAADLADTYGHGLDLRGTVGIAPPHLSLGTDSKAYRRQAAAPRASTYLAMVLSGSAATDPSLEVRSLLTPQGWSRYHDLETRCVDELESDRAGPAGLTPSQFFKGTQAVDLIEKRERLTDAANARPSGPVLLLSGGTDDVVPRRQVAELADLLDAHGASVTYRNYEWASHHTLPFQALPDIHAWITETLGST